MFSSSNKVEIFTEKNAYQPGETIKGYVETKVFTKQAVKGIYISIHGTEKTVIIEKISKTVPLEGEELNTAMRIRLQENSKQNSYQNNSPFTKKVKVESVTNNQRDIINLKSMLNNFRGVIDIGEYNIPFEIILPNILPNSFAKETIEKKNHGEIVYLLFAEVSVVDTFSFNWKCEQNITIFNNTMIPCRPASFSAYDLKVTTCCFSQGNFDTSISIDGDVFSPGDHITGILKVKSKCSKKLSCSVSLKRHLLFKTKITCEDFRTISSFPLPDVENGADVSLPFKIPIPRTLIHASHQSDFISCCYSVEYSFKCGFNYFDDGPTVTIRHPCEKTITSINIDSNTDSIKIVDSDVSVGDLPPAYSRGDEDVKFREEKNK